MALFIQYLYFSYIILKNNYSSFTCEKLCKLNIPKESIPSNKLFIRNFRPPIANLTWAAVTLKNENSSFLNNFTSLIISIVMLPVNINTQRLHVVLNIESQSQVKKYLNLLGSNQQRPRPTSGISKIFPFSSQVPSILIFGIRIFV